MTDALKALELLEDYLEGYPCEAEFATIRAALTAPAQSGGPIRNLTLVKKPFETNLIIREADGDRALTRKEVQTLLAYYRYGVDASLAPSYAQWRASYIQWRAVADGLADALSRVAEDYVVNYSDRGKAREALAAYAAAKEATL